MVGAILGAMYGDSIIHEEDILLLDETNKTSFRQLADSFAVVAKNIIIEDIAFNEKRKSIYK